MSAVGKALAKWGGALAFSAWAFAFIVLLDRGNFKRFLRPEFGAFILMGLLLLLAMLGAMVQKPTASECGHGRRSSGALARLAKLLLLLLPLAFLLNASDAVLDVKAFEVRSTGAAGGAGAASESQAKAKPSLEPSLLEISTDPKAFDGKRVSTLGMFYQDETSLKRFGPGSFIVFRFAVLCCAADARPVAVAVRPEKSVSFEKGSWTIATGTLKVQEVEGGTAAVLENAEVEEAKAPENPYLYP